MFWLMFATSVRIIHGGKQKDRNIKKATRPGSHKEESGILTAHAHTWVLITKGVSPARTVAVIHLRTLSGSSSAVSLPTS
jgi:hypothetical protein